MHISGHAKRLANFSYEDEDIAEMIWSNMKKVHFVGIKSVIRFNENQDPVITVNIRRTQCKCT